MDRQNTSVYHPKTGIAVLKKVRYAHGGLCPRRPMPSRTSYESSKGYRYPESFRLKFHSEYIDRMILQVFSFDLVRPYDRFYQSLSRAP